MTLVLTGTNSDQIVMLTDGRLTSNGVPVEEDAGKLCSFVLGGARYAVGFTGLARVSGFDMRKWLLDALWDSAEPDLIKSMPTLTRFRECVSRDFAQLPALRHLRPSDKRAEFMFAGYLNNHPPEHSVLATAVVSNCRDTIRRITTPTSWREFALCVGREPLPRTTEPVLVGWAGAAAAITKRDEEALHSLLRQRKPYWAIIDKATEIMMEGADRPKAAGTVGKRIVWLRIPSNYGEAMESGHYSAQPLYDTFMPDMVVRTPGGSRSAAFVSMSSLERDKPPAEAIHKVHRHAPCPCKSGKRFKSCHGRRPRFRRPASAGEAPVAKGYAQ